jgi:hemerythrin-like domain-containing protein
MTIIEALVAEHRIFLKLFEQIEHALPRVKTVDEIALMCRLLEAPLQDHGGAEADLAYIALDHILHQQHRLTRLHHDHREIDGLLKEVERIKDLPRARSRLKAALGTCRAHFSEEERTVFPRIEKALQHETLLILGRVWKSKSLSSRQPVK